MEEQSVQLMATQKDRQMKQLTAHTKAIEMAMQMAHTMAQMMAQMMAQPMVPRTEQPKAPSWELVSMVAAATAEAVRAAEARAAVARQVAVTEEVVMAVVAAVQAPPRQTDHSTHPSCSSLPPSPPRAGPPCSPQPQS